MGMLVILHKPAFRFVLTDLTLRQQIKVSGDGQVGAPGCLIGRGFDSAEAGDSMRPIAGGSFQVGHSGNSSDVPNVWETSGRRDSRSSLIYLNALGGP